MNKRRRHKAKARRALLKAIQDSLSFQDNPAAMAALINRAASLSKSSSLADVISELRRM